MPDSWSLAPLLSKNDDEGPKAHISALSEDEAVAGRTTYRLYKRRFAGLFGLFMLNVVAAMGWPWFGPIATSTSQEFNITLDQVNWLANIISCVYLPSTILIPWIVSTYGVRRSCDFGAVCLIASGWVRYAGTAPGLSSTGSFALLISGQFVSAIAQAIYQVLAPKYSESWFKQNGRTTATMIVAISNPIGAGVGQLISPLVGNVKQSILILAIISSAVVPVIFLISDKPPTPPTASADQEARTLSSLLLDTIGKPRNEKYLPMTRRQRFDFVIIMLGFGTNVAVINTFSILSSQDLSPYGYTEDISGFMGATLLLAGIVAAGVTSPLFDRVFTTRMGLTVKVLVPILAVAWISLIWAIRPDNAGPLFTIFALIGVCGVTLLPVALELAVEQTGAAEASSAMLWFTGNAFTIMFILSETALKAGPDGSPPNNVKNGLIFQGAFLGGLALLVIPFKGEQTRRMQDEANVAASKTDVYEIPVHFEYRDDDQGFADQHSAFHDSFE